MKGNRFINKMKALELIHNSKKYVGFIIQICNRSFTRLLEVELRYHIKGSECPIMSHRISRKDRSE